MKEGEIFSPCFSVFPDKEKIKKGEKVAEFSRVDEQTLDIEQIKISHETMTDGLLTQMAASLHPPTTWHFDPKCVERIPFFPAHNFFIFLLKSSK